MDDYDNSDQGGYVSGYYTDAQSHLNNNLFGFGTGYSIWKQGETGSFAQVSGGISYYPNVSFCGLNQNGYIFGVDASGVSTIWKPDMTVLPTQNLPQSGGSPFAPYYYDAALYMGLTAIPGAVINNPLQVLAGGQYWENNQLNYLVDLVSATPAAPAGSPPANPFVGFIGYSINDGGAIAGTAEKIIVDSNGNPILDDNGQIQYETHGVVLMPIAFVRETTPGSGDFEPITHNGLDDSAVLPIFRTESGTGRSVTLSSNLLTATLSQNLSGSSTAAMAVTLQNKAGSTDSGTLTETSAGSGIFTNGSITVTLAPTSQTTSDSTVDTLNVLVTDATLGLSSQALTLQESTATSKSFSTVPNTAVVTLSSSLSTTAINTINLDLITGSFPFESTLTETAVNSRVFQDTAGTTVTITNYTSGASGSMNVAITATFLPATGFVASLNETGTSLQYTNYQKNIGDMAVETPETNGQDIFYVQLPGTTATSLTLISGSNQVTVQATPVSGQTNLLRTGKLVLIAPGDSFSASDITTLTASPPSGGGSPTVQLKMYGQTIIDPGTVGDAYLCAFHPSFILGLNNIDVGGHLKNVAKLLTVGGYSNAGVSGPIVSNGLGWSAAPPATGPTKSEILSEIPYHSIFYYFGFGASAVADVSPLTGIKCWANSGSGYDNITPADIQGANVNLPGTNVQNHYSLVFLNACLTADRQTGTAAEGFLNSFNADVLVGWQGPQIDQNDVADGEQFLALLAQKNATVASAIEAANRNPATTNDTPDNSLLGFLGDGDKTLLLTTPTPKP